MAKRLDGLGCYLLWSYASAQATVFDGDPAPPQKKGTPTATQFLTNVYCGQTAGWMKTRLGTGIDFGPGHIVVDGVPSSPRNGHSSPPVFRPMSIVATVAYLSYC